MASVSEEVAALRGTRPATVKDLLRHPSFSKLAAAMSVSSLGDWIGFVAVTFLVKQLGGSAAGFAVSGVLLIRLLPSVLFGPFAGALIDRFDRKKMMVAADIGRGIFYASMPFLGRLWAIYVLSFFVECLSLLWTPARDASLPNLVPRRQLANANAVSMITTYGTLPVGGILFSVLAVISTSLGSHAQYLSYLKNSPWALALWLDAGTFFFSAWKVSQLPIRAPRSKEHQRARLQDLGRDIVEGVHFLREHALVSVMTTGIVVAFSAVGAVLSLGTIFAGLLVRVPVAGAGAAAAGSAGAAAWGVIVATFGVGMALGLVTVNTVARLIERERLFWTSMVGSATALILLSMQPAVALAAVFCVVLGYFVGLTWVTGYTMLQETVADEFRGRTFASITVLSRFGLFISLLVFPFLAQVLGVHEVHIGSFGIDLSGARGAMAVAGLAVVGGGLYTRRGLQRYRISLPKRLNLIPRLKKAPPEGLFVVFEGVEGSGKGTQIELARQALEAAGRDVVVTREPGGTPVGERLRAMLLDPDTGYVGARTEALLFSAARAQLVTSVIRPALEAGSIVMCDRYVDSSIAYQGVARGLGEPDVLSLNVWATQGLFPDLVVLLHVEPELGLERARTDDNGADRIESEPDDFHAKVSDAYLRIADEHPERFAVIDASAARASVHDKVMEAIGKVLPPLAPHGHEGSPV